MLKFEVGRQYDVSYRTLGAVEKFRGILTYRGVGETEKSHHFDDVRVGSRVYANIALLEAEILSVDPDGVVVGR